MIDCQHALHLFRQSFIDRVTMDSKTLQIMQEHIDNCSICQSKIANLVSEIQHTKEVIISCESCQAHLADYYETIETNQPLSDELLPVALHVLDCPDCAEEFAQLTEVMALDAANALPILQTKPSFDLSFLPKPIHYWQKVDAQVRRLFSDVVITIRQAVAQFAQMPAPLTPMVVMTGATRSPGLQTPPQLLELPKGDSGLHIALQILRPADKGATLIVLIKDVPDGTALEHIRIHLYDAERRLLFGLTTDGAGRVQFHELSKGRYFIQVRYQQIKEEIPVLITDGIPL